MSGFLGDVSNWIQDHQALVVAVGIPILTAIAAGIVALSTTRMNFAANASDRELQKRIWVLDQKKMELEKLRKLCVEFSTLTFAMKVDVENPFTHGGANQISANAAHENTERLIALISEANLLIVFADEEAEKLSPAMWYEFESIKPHQDLDTRQPEDRFAAVSKRYIHRAQKRLFEEALT